MGSCAYKSDCKNGANSFISIDCVGKLSCTAGFCQKTCTLEESGGIGDSSLDGNDDDDDSSLDGNDDDDDSSLDGNDDDDSSDEEGDSCQWRQRHTGDNLAGKPNRRG